MGTLVADINQTVAGGIVTVFSLGTAEPKYKSLTAPYLLSAAGIISGVSFFIASSKSRKRAASVATVSYFKMEQGTVLKPSSICTQRFPAVAFRFTLR
jgi:hypothetical protein